MSNYKPADEWRKKSFIHINIRHIIGELTKVDLVNTGFEVICKQTHFCSGNVAFLADVV